MQIQAEKDCLTILLQQTENDQEQLEIVLEMIHTALTKIIVIIENFQYYNFLKQGLIVAMFYKSPKVEYIFVIHNEKQEQQESEKIIFVTSQTEINQYRKLNQKQNSFEGEKFNEHGIPIILEQLINYFTNNLEHEGIFRKCAVNSEVQQLLQEVKNYNFENIENANPHLVACTLKQYLIQLPIQLITSKNVFLKDLDIISVINDLSEMNARVLYFLISFFKEVAKHEPSNKMNTKSLAMLLAPTFVKISNSPQDIQLQIGQSISFLSKLMENIEILAPQFHYTDFITSIQIEVLNEVSDEQLILEWQKLCQTQKNDLKIQS